MNKRNSMRLLAAALLAGCVLVPVTRAQDNGGPDGPPPARQQDGGGKHRPGGIHIIPPFVMQKLDLTDDQKEQIAALEKETKAKLQKILTADQMKTLESARPPHPGGPGGPGGGPDDGPGPGGPGGPGGGDQGGPPGN
jgi:Spy/CpxP family protein refolding chaperone